MRAAAFCVQKLKALPWRAIFDKLGDLAVILIAGFLAYLWFQSRIDSNAARYSRANHDAELRIDSIHEAANLGLALIDATREYFPALQESYAHLRGLAGTPTQEFEEKQRKLDERLSRADAVRRDALNALEAYLNAHRYTLESEARTALEDLVKDTNYNYGPNDSLGLASDPVKFEAAFRKAIKAAIFRPSE